MEEDFDKMRQERLDNMDLVPVDEKGEHIELIKEQILDLNDKFDFLISMMIKSRKVIVKEVEDEDGNKSREIGLNLDNPHEELQSLPDGQKYITDPVKGAKAF
jgi:hypothetical protein